MITIAKSIIIFFGAFIIIAGIIMLLKPKLASAILRKAGSTNLINYAEITVRMIPATALILYADFSKFPDVMTIFGWFMLATSLVLYFVPRKIHHSFSVKAADILKPLYFQIISPFSIAIGCLIIYSIT